MVSFSAPAALPPGKERLYSLERGLGGSQSRSGRGGVEKNSQALLGLVSPIQPVVVNLFKARQIENAGDHSAEEGIWT
jgi:hypothetical protein